MIEIQVKRVEHGWSVKYRIGDGEWVEPTEIAEDALSSALSTLGRMAPTLIAEASI